MSTAWIAGSVVLFGTPTLLLLRALVEKLSGSRQPLPGALAFVLLVPSAALTVSWCALLSLATGLAPTTLVWMVSTLGWLWLGAIVLLGKNSNRELAQAPLHPAREQWPRWSLFSAAIIVPLTASRAMLAPWAPDAQDMWFLKARALAAPGSSLLDFVSNPLFISNNYPPLGSSLGAAAMMLGGHGDLLAQWATTILTLSLALLLGWILGRWSTSGLAAVSLGLVLPFLTLGLGKGNGFDGYVDTPAALAVVVTLLALWLPEKTPVDLLILTIAVSAAVLIKNESLLFVAAILGIRVVWYWNERRRLEQAVFFAGSAALSGVLWAVLVRLRGAVDEPWQWGSVLPWSEGWWERCLAIAEFSLRSWPMRAAAVFALSLSLLALLETWREKKSGDRKTWSRSGLDPSLVAATVCWVHSVAAALIILAIYLASPKELQWHLRVSFSRVALAFEMLLCTAGCLAGASLLRYLGEAQVVHGSTLQADPSSVERTQRRA